MKKLFALLLAVVLVFSLFACTAGGKTACRKHRRFCRDSGGRNQD